MFSFDANIRPHVIAEPESKKSIICDDFSEKAEEIPISVVNALNDTKKPGMGYRKRPILYNLNHSTAETGFCSGCSCTGLYKLEKASIRQNFPNIKQSCPIGPF